MSDAFLRVALARRLAAELVSDAWDRAIARVRHDWRASFRALRALKRLLRETPSADLWWRAPYWEGVRREIRAGDARIAPYVLARRHQSRRYGLPFDAPWAALPASARRRS